MPGIYKKFSEIPQFTDYGRYQVTIPIQELERSLEMISEGIGLDMDPDFQRGHVWTDEQRIKYVEFMLRGGRSSRDILFNQSGWFNSKNDRGEPLTLVDGKQRLEAARKFLHNEIPAFGSFYSEFEGRIPLTICSFTFHINDLPTKSDVLRWYIDLNSGGVTHTSEEIEKVRRLLETDTTNTPSM